jgi:transposase
MTTIAKKLAQVKPGSVFVGIDLSLDDCAVVVLDASGQRLDRFKTAHRRDGYEYLLQRWQQVVTQSGASGVLVGMEPTNYYWKLVALFLSQHQVPFRLVNAFTVKRHREGDQLDKAKDDWRDAFMIADLLRTGKFNETQLRTGAYAELQLGYAAYCRLRHDRGRQLTLLTNTARQVFPELPRVFKDLTCHTVRAVLRSVPAAAHIRSLTCDEFLAQVRLANQGQRLAVKRFRQLHALAATSIGLTEGLDSLGVDLQNSRATLELLDQQTLRLFDALRPQFRALPEAPYVCSIQGLDEVFALGIVAETGDLTCYDSGKDLIKLAGTQPTPNASGRRQRSRTPFSKKGRSRLRWVLYWATLQLLNRNDAIAHYYHRLQTRAKHPLTKMEAFGACMNKLLWYVWCTGHGRNRYDPDHWQSIGESV